MPYHVGTLYYCFYSGPAPVEPRMTLDDGSLDDGLHDDGSLDDASTHRLLNVVLSFCCTLYNDLPCVDGWPVV